MVASSNQFEYVGKDLEAMSFAINYHTWIINIFKPYIGSIVAEVGAGTGNISKLLLETDIINELILFEPSESMYTLLNDNLRNNKLVSIENDCFLNASNRYLNYFDTILYINVLEHIENDKHELMSVWKALKSNGCLCIFVPALTWLYSDFDKSIGHFRRYHKKQLHDLVKSIGFQISEFRYVDFIGLILWYINFVLMKKSLNKNNVSMYDKYIFPITRIIENTIRFPIGKNILMVCKKL
jgi:SAM-dependent methyltransferase